MRIRTKFIPDRRRKAATIIQLGLCRWWYAQSCVSVQLEGYSDAPVYRQTITHRMYFSSVFMIRIIVYLFVIIKFLWVGTTVCQIVTDIGTRRGLAMVISWNKCKEGAKIGCWYRHDVQNVNKSSFDQSLSICLVKSSLHYSPRALHCAHKRAKSVPSLWSPCYADSIA